MPGEMVQYVLCSILLMVLSMASWIGMDVYRIGMDVYNVQAAVVW